MRKQTAQTKGWLQGSSDRTPLLGNQFAERDAKTTCPAEIAFLAAENPTFEWDSPFLGPYFFFVG